MRGFPGVALTSKSVRFWVSVIIGILE